MADALRRAAASFVLHDDTGRVLRQGDAEAVIGDESLSVGPVTAQFLDADGLRVGDYALELDLWPDRRLVVSQLGRRFETFAAELRRVRNQVRVTGILAHGISRPDVFPAALLDGAAIRPAELQVYDTHVTAVPENGDPFQIPLGAITEVRAVDDPPRVVVEAGGTRAEVGLVGRRRDEFCAAVTKRIAVQSRLLAELTGHDMFVDGRGVVRAQIRGFDWLIERVATPKRLACAHALLATATDEPRLGFVQLVDLGGLEETDDEAVGTPANLPKDWASFLIVPAGTRTAVELLAGPAAATYVFGERPETVNRDLQAMHFRRAPLALTNEQAEVTPFSPHRLALRKLEPLRRLRARMTARLIHNDGWSDALHRALGADA